MRPWKLKVRYEEEKELVEGKKGSNTNHRSNEFLLILIPFIAFLLVSTNITLS